ncbi:MAG: GNAT family N-acetyltransferase [Planctomycetaceae bacterium]|nr:GNAT family N-acetyltransferase [Planctomycetaceae bacterium]
MAGDRLILRVASLGEADELAQLEAACWPAGLAAPAEQIAARITAYADGQWVASDRDRPVGYSSAQRITFAPLDQRPLRYDALTDADRFTRTHVPTGPVYQLVGVSVHPEARGQRIGRQLIDHQVTRAWSLPGVQRVLGFTRPTGRQAAPELPLDDYVRTQGVRLPTDAVLEFHLAAGAVIVSMHEEFREIDEECLGAGVLIEYLPDSSDPKS